MPTRADFEAAAAKFQAAAGMVGDLASGADGAAAATILRGGSLGRRVPERISSASATARSCEVLIDAAAQLCSDRAATIADYEARLDAYDDAKERYQQDKMYYRGVLDRWWLDETNEARHPGDPPVAPEKPTPPPSWADVRRP